MRCKYQKIFHTHFLMSYLKFQVIFLHYQSDYKENTQNFLQKLNLLETQGLWPEDVKILKDSLNSKYEQ